MTESESVALPLGDAALTSLIITDYLLFVNIFFQFFSIFFVFSDFGTKIKESGEIAAFDNFPTDDFY